MLNENRFEKALKRVASLDNKSGIGTLSEKTLHRVLKYYLEDREECHEVPYMGSVADIKNEDGITEIQTGSVTPIIPKLKKLIKEERLTLVLPIICEKMLLWLDPLTGELCEPKKSPKKGRYTDILPELSKISDILFSDNLTVKLMLIDADEYKYLDGYGESRKKKATRIERIPKRLVSEVLIKTEKDLSGILPPLPTPFTSQDFNKATGLKRRKAFFSLKMLVTLGIVRRNGKRGNAFLYEKA